jgi:Uma2 family endonuclease
MATNPRTAVVTLDDFIAAAEASETRIEYVDGKIVAMSGGSLAHGRIAQRIARFLGNRAMAGCEVVTGTLVASKVRESAFIPDVAVYCGEPRLERVRGTDLLLNPVLLIEVLSPSTADYDRGTKWESYRRIPTLQDYLLVSQDQPRVERYTRHGEHFWLFGETVGLDSEIRLESLNATITLAEIYEGIALESAEGDEG